MSASVRLRLTADFLPGGRLPQDEIAVLIRTGQNAPIRAEQRRAGAGRLRAAVYHQGLERFSGLPGGIPDFDGAVRLAEAIRRPSGL